MNKVRCMVQIGGSRSEEFTSGKGLRQGDALACLLFNIALEKAVRDSGIQVGGTVFSRTAQLLAYADDIDIAGRSLQAVSDGFLKLVEAARNIGLKVNAAKTKYMVTEEIPRPGEEITIGEYSIEKVSEFVYLGSLVTQDNVMDAEIKRRILAANRCYYGLSPYLRSRALSKDTKILLYKAIIRPILLYGSETWTVSKAGEQNLKSFERKILRKIFGAVKVDQVWRRRTNEELKDLYKDSDVVWFMKLGRLRWAGHVARMAENDLPRKILTEVIHATRRRGRPRLRWSDGVAGDAGSMLGVRNWMAAAQDRDNWWKLMREAKTRHRVVAPNE